MSVCSFLDASIWRENYLPETISYSLSIYTEVRITILLIKAHTHTIYIYIYIYIYILHQRYPNFSRKLFTWVAKQERCESSWNGKLCRKPKSLKVTEVSKYVRSVSFLEGNKWRSFEPECRKWAGEGNKRQECREQGVENMPKGEWDRRECEKEKKTRK